MENVIKSLNEIPPYLFYNKKNGNDENQDRTFVPIIIKTDNDEEPPFKGMYAMLYKNGVINPEKFLFKVGGNTYEEVASKLVDAFDKMPVRNRIEDGVFWKNKKGAPKQAGFDMG